MENSFSNIKERILQIADYYGISKVKFFEELEISYGNFKGSAKERPINSSFLENLLTKYPDVNPDWVLLGKGEIMRNSSVNNFNGDKNFANNGQIVGSHIDYRDIHSDSPDVLRAQIDLLDERIKEKDAQIKEKDAQIKEKDAQIARLLGVIEQMSAKG